MSVHRCRAPLGFTTRAPSQSRGVEHGISQVPYEELFSFAWVGVLYVATVESYAAIRRFLWQMKPPAMIVRDERRRRARED